MPIYEYHCTECGHEFEVIQKATDRPLRKCEACGRPKAKRGISRTTFVLKGGGWYATEYGNRKAEKTAACDRASGESSSCATCEKASKEGGDGPTKEKKAS